MSRGILLYNEMSSIFADQWRPPIWAQTKRCGGGGGGVAGSQPMSTAVHRSPNEVWRSITPYLTYGYTWRRCRMASFPESLFWRWACPRSSLSPPPSTGCPGCGSWKSSLVRSRTATVATRDIHRDYQRPPFLWGCTRNILTLRRETLTQYITVNRGGSGESVLYSCILATVTSCIDTSVRIVTNPRRYRTPTYIYSSSLWWQQIPALLLSGG